MLNEEKPGRYVYFFMVILVVLVCFLTYKIRDYAGEVKSAKEALKQYQKAYQYYQSIFAGALTMTTDGTRYLPKGTIVILPAEETESNELEK